MTYESVCVIKKSHLCFISTVYRQSNFEPIPITIYKISMTDYETHHYDKDLLRQSATILASLKLNPDLDLESIRRSIEHYCEENPNTKLNSDWCYLDCKSIIVNYLCMI